MYYIIAFIFGGVLFSIYWKYIKSILMGRNIAILGDAQTGKTTLQNYMRFGKIPERVPKTGTKDTLTGKTISMDEITFKISKGEDIGGDDIFFRNNWKDIFMNSDSCIYILDCFKVFNKDEEHLRRIKQHAKHLINWKKEKQKLNKSFKLIFVGSFLDKVINLESLDPNQIVNKKIEIFENLEGPVFDREVNPMDFHIGSLAKDSYASILLRTILLDLAGLNNKFINYILKFL